jgi:hypothetical protein
MRVYNTQDHHVIFCYHADEISFKCNSVYMQTKLRFGGTFLFLLKATKFYSSRKHLDWLWNSLSLLFKDSCGLFQRECNRRSVNQTRNLQIVHRQRIITHNTAALSYNHYFRGRATMHSACIVDLPVTFNYINILNVAEIFVYGKCMWPEKNKTYVNLHAKYRKLQWNKRMFFCSWPSLDVKFG